MPTDETLPDAIQEFHRLKTLAEKAVGQVKDDDLPRALDAESNSLAVIVKHIAGNLRSHWTDFLTTDGDKPDRNREVEFLSETQDTRESLMARWESGWRCLFDTLDSLKAADLPKTVYIRGKPLTVSQAIQRALSHSAYHIGQIVFLAKHFAGSQWQTLSIARGKSDEYRSVSRRN